LIRAVAALALLATIGTSSLLLLGNEQTAALPEEVVQQVGGQTAFALVAAIQPLILAMIAIAVGLFSAPKLGLRSLVVDRASRRASPVALQPRSFGAVAVTCGLAAGVIIVLGDLAFSPWTHDALSRLAPTGNERLQALLLGVMYGGVTEEIIARWGLMSFTGWLLLRARIDRRIAVAVAVGVAALLFAIGHLPALAAATQLDSALITRTLVLNTAAGVLFGFAFARHSLEAAMAAHALAHIIIFVARATGVAY
jgi:hypothetical protein